MRFRGLIIVNHVDYYVINIYLIKNSIQKIKHKLNYNFAKKIIKALCRALEFEKYYNSIVRATALLLNISKGKKIKVSYKVS